MKRQLFFLAFIISLLFLFIQSCKDENLIVNNNKLELPDGISGLTTFNYEYLGTAPFYVQTTMITEHQNNIYRYGAKWFHKFDITNNNWNEIALPNESFWRWDGATVTIDDNIFIVAISPGQNVTSSDSLDILKYNIQTSTLEHTGEKLPTNFSYPAYCVHDKNIFFLSTFTDSVYSYNSISNKSSAISGNPFLTSQGSFQRNGMTLSSGKDNNFFYVFGGYVSQNENLFYRLNLNTNIWEKLEIPSSLLEKRMVGASFNNSFILIADSNLTYEYSFSDSKWKQDTSTVPLYIRTTGGELVLGETSFFAKDNSLYVTDIYSYKLWEITK